MDAKTYSVRVDGTEYRIRVEEDGEAVRVENRENGRTQRVQLEEIDHALFEVRMDDRCFVVGGGRTDGGASLVVDGRTFEADVEEARFREARKAAQETDRPGDLHPVVASIPGQVIEVSVSEGDEVEVGQTLLLLSAMKLENEVQSEKNGTVESIKVSQGDTVEKEQVLMEIQV